MLGSLTPNPRRKQGFTFLELLVVLSILAVITAMIVPIYGASVSAMQRRSLRGDFVATIYYLQELSIQQSRELRLYVDDDEGTYWAEGWVSGLGDDKVFEALTDRKLGDVQPFPDSLKITRIQARKDRGRSQHYIAFYPSGGCDPAKIRFGELRGGKTTFSIETTGALGDVVVTP